jgi:hypothetical protein
MTLPAAMNSASATAAGAIQPSARIAFHSSARGETGFSVRAAASSGESGAACADADLRPSTWRSTAPRMRTISPSSAARTDQ